MASGGPTFVLRGIDMRQIRDWYKEGLFTEFKLRKSNINLLPAVTISDNSSGAPDAANYTFKDKNNSSMVLVSSNYRNYENINGSTACDRKYCTNPLPNPPVQIPVGVMKVGTKIHYLGEGAYCSEACALEGIRQNTNLPYLHRDPLYLNSESTLKMLWKLNGGKGDLEPSPDPRILKKNGGSVDSPSKYYHRLSNIIPVKVEYLQYDR